jgi:indolepyruvate ferredoxin oxidoreductase beta subunit
MHMTNSAVCNVVVLGVGGQGVLRASDILADVVFAQGFEVRKADVHGMSQRGGIVCSDVRFGTQVWSPMVPAGEADFALLLHDRCEERARALLRPEGQLVSAAAVPVERLPHPRCLNVALLGALSVYLPPPRSEWEVSLKRRFSGHLFELNRRSFLLGRHARQVA